MKHKCLLNPLWIYFTWSQNWTKLRSWFYCQNLSLFQIPHSCHYHPHSIAKQGDSTLIVAIRLSNLSRSWGLTARRVITWVQSICLCVSNQGAYAVDLTYAVDWLLINQISTPQAYIKKGRTPIQVFPVPNAYTNSFVISSCIICILFANCN